MGTLRGAEAAWIERRIEERVASRLRAHFRVLGEDAFLRRTADAVMEPPEDVATVLDVSTGGLGMEGEVQLLAGRDIPKGTPLAVELQLDDLPVPVHGYGRVAWSRAAEGKFRCGLELAGLDPGGLERLETWIRRRRDGREGG